VALQKFIIERDIPKVGTFDREQLRQAAAKSNEVLRQVGPDIQWVESYVADNKTFCVYLAKDEAIIREHAEIWRLACGETDRTPLLGKYSKGTRKLSGCLALTRPFAPCHVLQAAAATGRPNTNNDGGPEEETQHMAARPA